MRETVAAQAPPAFPVDRTPTPAMNIPSRTADFSTSVMTWVRSHVRFAPERRHMNYFGQPYCPDCQRAGRDNVLRVDDTGAALVCSSGHRIDRSETLSARQAR